MTYPAEWTDDRIDAILTMFDNPTLARGRDYAFKGMIDDITWVGNTVSGYSEGSGRKRYRCRVAVTFGPRARAVASCTCPVSQNCKHCAALIIAATSDAIPASFEADDASTLTLSRWRTLVAEITADTRRVQTPPLPVRLVFAEEYTSTASSVKVRPTVLSSTGRWVSTRVTWKKLVNGVQVDPVVGLEPLTRLAVLLSTARGNGPSDESMSLMYAPSIVWSILRDAVDAGVELRYTHTHGRELHVDLDAPITTALHVEPSGSGVAVGLQVLIDGRPVSTTEGHRRLIGRPRVHGVAAVLDGTAHLGRLPDLTPTESMLLISDESLRVAESEIGEFRDALASVAPERVIDVAPDAFPATAVTGPFPVLRIGTRAMTTADWLIGYEVDGEIVEYPLDGSVSGRYRAPSDEAAMWDQYRSQLEAVARTGHGWVAAAAQRLQAELPRWRGDFKKYNHLYAVLRQLQGGCTVDAAFTSAPAHLRTSTSRFTEIEAAVLWTEVVPQITDGTDIRVVTDGPTPVFRRAEETPSLHFSGDATTDWFDLTITVDVDGHSVPLPEVIAALASGQTHMMVDHTTYFSLDVPELTTLRERLEEARDMGELEGDRASSQSLNASLWDELLELGVVDEQLASWRDRMSRLAQAEPPEPVAPPVGLRAQLRPYQQDGLDWLSFLWDNGLGGVLADDMGLGKTVQSLALMQRAVDADPTARFLVVAPTSVISNWAAEVRRFVPDLDVMTVTATQKRSGSPLYDRVGNANVVVTSYALLRLDVDAFSAMSWDGAVFDEAQFLKNHNAKTHQAARRLDAPFKLAITGTPMENRVMELWSLVSVVAPGLYPSPLLFKDHFAGPIESGQAPEKLDLLRRRIRPIMLRRTKSQVLTDLPEKQEQVLHLELEPAHRKVYDTHLARHRQETLGLLDDFDGNRIQILRALTRLRQLSLHPGLVDDEHTAVKSAKIEYLAEQLPILIDEGHSALVFSSFTGFLGLVAARLDKAGIAYSYIDGSTPVVKRADQIEQFARGATQVFLISLKAGGFGLNLTAADYCFLADPWWNPAAEAQAVDRAHRIGQHRAVTVYRMASVDTIEDKVIELQNRKRELFNALIDDGEAFSGTITADDVRSLFA
ncbi:DEAD/DEAH box helicase [Gordonia malaquae]|uniref:DEAD/DEAH box helicase n=1 Tax=Gordonia malaquae TaxID=410332 RepID=UPI00301B1FD9